MASKKVGRALGMMPIPSDLVPVVKRMRKAEAEDAATENDTARECGADWAKNHARPRQLKRLEPAHEVLSGTHDDQMATSFVSLLNGSSADWDEAREFFNTATRENSDVWNTTDYIEAFAAGALAVWNEVKAHINAA